MSFTAKVEVESERKNIKRIVFKGSILYIIWDNDTASKYQYNHVKDGDMKMIEKERKELWVQKK